MLISLSTGCSKGETGAHLSWLVLCRMGDTSEGPSDDGNWE